jgi:hypothetical protein
MIHRHPEQTSEACDNPITLSLDDDDFARAVTIYRRARDDAQRRHAECAPWFGAGRRVWREPIAGEALRQRRNARLTARIAARWVMTALRDWSPSGERGN